MSIRVLKDASSNTKFMVFWLTLSLVLHIIASIFSIGHYSADEYFQILEFVSYKLGDTPARHLPVEFHEEMRPWLQPSMYYLMVRAWKWIGIENPLIWVTSIRAISGFFGWISVVTLALCSQFWFKGEQVRRFAVICLSLIWFYPALHVRPSSESLAGSFVLIGMGLAYLGYEQAHAYFKKPWLWLLGGVCLGMAFEFRYQVGFMVAGLFMWLTYFGVYSKKIKPIHYAFILFGFFIAFALGRIVDHWGYGTWTFAPWKYIDYNLVRGEVSRYGGSPWWDIFRRAQTETWPILGFIVAICTVIAWIRFPLHILTWTQVPFFLVHEMISHKETRFFFPIAAAAPILIALSAYSAKNGQFLRLPDRKWIQTLFRWGLRFLILENVFALIVLLFIPMARHVQYLEGLYRFLPHSESNVTLYTLNEDPYIILGNPSFFYRPKNVTVSYLKNKDELKALIAAHPDQAFWVFYPHFHMGQDPSEKLAQSCKRVYNTLPSWSEKVNWTNWIERTRAWGLFRCQETNH